MREYSKSSPHEAGLYDRTRWYGGTVYDGEQHVCKTCLRRSAFGVSVRIRQDCAAIPVCVDCRLNVRRA